MIHPTQAIRVIPVSSSNNNNNNSSHSAPRWPTYTRHLSAGENAGQQQHLDRHGEDEDEGERQRGLGGHDGPQQRQTHHLDAGEQVHPQRPDLEGETRRRTMSAWRPDADRTQQEGRSHLAYVGVVRVILGRHEQQHHPLGQLDAVQRHHAHVEEDPEQHGQGNLPQQVADDDGEA